ncbi:MAG: hypothetical protein JO314_07950 [Acidobacteria bacterium]|nr:hypothetical protein [Acidobacteriota bacterium]
MQTLITVGLILFALTFCGLQERLKSVSSGANSNAASTNSNSSGTSTSSASAEKAKPSSSQQAIIDGGTEAKWDQQGISWKLPPKWKKMDVDKETFTYQSPDNAYLLVNITSLGDDFPADTSLKSYYEMARQQQKTGKYDSSNMVEIDGIPGVESIEAMPKDKTDPRRHQWIAYRTYKGEVQQLSVMTSTTGANFDKHADDFTAILYSMKVTK